MRQVLEAYLLRAFRKRFYLSLEKALTQGGHESQTIRSEIEGEYDRLWKQNQTLLSDRQSRTHLMMTCLVLAAYHRLSQRSLNEEKKLNVLRLAFVEPQKMAVQKYIRLALKFSRDPFKMVTKTSKDKERKVYGAAFHFDREVDNDSKYRLQVKKCFYNDFFRTNNCPQLTPVFCEFDNIWGDELHGPGVNVVFTRPHTLGYGAKSCVFDFERV